MQLTEPDYKKVVGKCIKRLRLREHLTQEDLAARCGIYRTYLSRIEAGTANPTVLVLSALAIALKVHLSDLFQETDEGIAAVGHVRHRIVRG